MKYIDVLFSITILLICVPVLSTQYNETGKKYREVIVCLKEIAYMRETINSVSEQYKKNEPLEESDRIRINTMRDKSGTVRDAILFQFCGVEEHWFLRR